MHSVVHALLIDRVGICVSVSCHLTDHEQQLEDMQRSAAQRSTLQHSTAQHSTAQHSTAQHSTAQHSTAGNIVMLAIPIQ